MMELPKPLKRTDLQLDLFNQLAIDDLYKKIIVPIDNLRSISKPTNKKLAGKNANTDPDFVIKRDFQNLTSNLTSPLESRTHCFYRTLGLPVVASSGSFYSPGFSPNADQKKRQEVESKISEPLLKSLIQRETVSQNLQTIFQNQGLSTTIYQLLLIYPRDFKLMKDGAGSLETDSQTKSSTARLEVIKKLDSVEQFSSALSDARLTFSSTPISSSLSNYQHSIKPLTLHPQILNTVQPDINNVSAMFLVKESDRNITDDTILFMPALENIIKIRLNGYQSNQASLAVLQKQLSEPLSTTSKIPVNFSIRELETSLAALTQDHKLTKNSINDLLKQFGSVEIPIIQGLVMTIKYLVVRLYQLKRDINILQAKVTWLPIVNSSGPEKQSTKFMSLPGLISESILENQILQTQILITASNTSQSANNNSLDLVSQNTNQTNSLFAQLKNLSRQKELILLEISKKTSEMEQISGEVAGLGLIDIIVIYCALWSVEIPVLLSLLDVEVWERLNTSFPNLQASRFNSQRTDVVSALDKIEKRINYLFDYADKIASDQRESTFPSSSDILL